MIQIRTFLIHQLSVTRVFGWNNDRRRSQRRDAPRTRSRTNLFQRPQQHRSVQVLFAAVFYPEGRSVPASSRTYFVGEFRSPFLAAMYLNFMEVAPRAEQLPFIVQLRREVARTLS